VDNNHRCVRGLSLANSLVVGEDIRLPRLRIDEMTTRSGSILIVDDEEMNRDMLSQRLEMDGYDVTTAADGRQALDLVERQSFDLVLLDVMMPGLSGLEVLSILRTRYSPAELPVILVTAKDRSDDIVGAFNLGASDYVIKPVKYAVALARIVTHVSLKRMHAELSRSEARYALAAKGTNDGLWDWDLEAGTVYYSPRWKALVGCVGGEIGSGSDEWFRRIHPDDVGRVRVDLDAHNQGLTPHFESEHRLLHKDGSYSWMLGRGMALRGDDGRVRRVAGSLTDITQGKVTDVLTGLPNRVLFTDHIEKAIERSQRQPDNHFAVLFLDIDRFKLINDSLGHLAGDQLLIGFAGRLTGCLRACDSVSRPFANSTFARLGGDEFTILLNGIKDAGEALMVANRIQTALLAPFNLGGHEVFTSASIGIAQSGPEYTRPDELLRDADTAMYRAKEQGRARCEIFDPIMRDRAVARLELETELRQAIEREEFRLHYQPIVSLLTNRPVGFEALIRWQHPRRGLIGPDQFLNVAEETEMILPIGRWVLNEACRQMHDWHTLWPDTPPLSVSVNVSGKQLIEAGFVDHVRACLLATGLEPQDLKLEITESAIMTDPDTAAAQLDRLRSLGVGVSLDDFGTGYSSLSYLRHFPIDTLKIDRSFLQQATSDDKGTEIVRAIVTLAHALSMNLVAEGVEELQQVDRMRSLGCENCQGYYFSRPLNVENAGRYLADVSQSIAPADGTTENAPYPCQPAGLAFQRQVDAISCP